MSDLVLQFAKAKSNVEASEEDRSNAAAAHKDVRAHLEADQALASCGIDTVLIGSYKRHVAISGIKDVDVLSRLPQVSRDIDPKQLLGYFVKVLRDIYGDGRVQAQSRSAKVEFPDYGLAVDVVPSRPSQTSSYIEIPNHTGGWQQTNPEGLTEMTTAMNNSYDGEYVPLVKLIRQTRRTHLGKRPGGFYFEILTYHAAQGGLDRHSVAGLFTAALARIAEHLQLAAAGVGVPDPTMPGEVIEVRATDLQMRQAAVKFAGLASQAAAALSADKCPAAKAYRDILGCNAEGVWVMEMPAACNEDGTPKTVSIITPGDRTVPAGDRRFA